MAHPVWPLFDLEVRTPRLALRYVDADLATRLALAAREPIHDPAEMPFMIPWTDVPSPERERNALQHYWRMWETTGAESWSLPFAVVVDGEVVGSQGISGVRFPTLRTVDTGSWLLRRVQGRGIGREMRRAVLHLAFAGLGAERATSAANLDNTGSTGVSRSLGYSENGRMWSAPRGVPVEQVRFLMERTHWEEHVRSDDVEIVGLEACLPLLGL